MCRLDDEVLLKNNLHCQVAAALWGDAICVIS